MKSSTTSDRNFRKTSLASAVFLGAIALSTGALAGAPATDDQKTAAELKASPASITNGLAVSELWSGTGFGVLSIQRSAPGEVEIHARMSDVFIVEEGRATAMLGGIVDGGRETAAGERRGGTIVGGHSRQLAPGDMLWVPAGEPHQIVPETGGVFRYVVVKVEARAGD